MAVTQHCVDCRTPESVSVLAHEQAGQSPTAVGAA